jgi:glycosyltransferase involved in cell wall biosynthesis
MEKKTKLLFYGDFVASTGFATVSMNILVPLHDTGKYDITVLGINYWGEPTPLQKLPNLQIMPVGINPDKDPYGRNYVKEYIFNADFDILFMLQDSFILADVVEAVQKRREAGKKGKVCIYFPVDGGMKSEWAKAMSVADIPVTYTQFAFDECVKAYPPIESKLKVIPHGANVTDFHPISHREAYEFKKAYLGPLHDKMLFSNINRNQIRKDIPRFLMAFKEMKKDCPDALAYCHCAIKDQGHNLDEVCRVLGLVIDRDVVFPHNFNPARGFPREILNKIYNMSDVVVSSATGEGWGLAQVEAMAAKTAVISPRNTACTEIIGSDRGLLVDSGHDVEHFIFLPHDNEVMRPIVSVSDMAKKMKMMYDDDVLRMTCAENGYKWVTNNLIWDKHIVPMWENIFDEMIKSIDEETKQDGSVINNAMFV